MRWSEWLIRARLFIVSYAALAVIFAVKAHGLVVRASFAGFAILGVLLGLLLLGSALRQSTHLVVFDAVEDKGGEVSGYLATYLLPFLSGPPSSVSDTVADAVYFTVAFLIFTRTQMGLVNPTLYLLGWRVAEATTGGRQVLVVCRSLPTAGVEVPVSRLAGGAGWVMRRRP